MSAAVRKGERVMNGISGVRGGWYRIWGAACVGAALLLGGGAEAAAEEANKPSEAQIYFSNGVDLLQATPPNYQDAYNQFWLAYEKSGRSWKVLGNLGLCALNLERDGEALEFYRKYLDQGGEEIDPGERSAIEKELLLVQGNLARAHFESKLTSAKLTVRRQGSSAPAQIYRLSGNEIDLGLRAGSFTVTAEAEGKKQVLEIVLEPGQEFSHVFDFVEKTPPASTNTARPVATEQGSSWTGLQTAGVVTAGVGVAALVGGVVTGLIAKSNESSAREGCREQPGGRLACPEASESEFESAQSLATVSTALFIGGGVLAATGLTLVLVGGGDSTEDAGLGKQALRGPSPFRVEIAPAPLFGGGGLWARGQF